MTCWNKQLSTYNICQNCQSLLSPHYEVCPICGQSVEAGTERHVYRILPHAVCDNCGYLTANLTGPCPVCDAVMDSHSKRKIVEVPVELEIVGIASE